LLQEDTGDEVPTESIESDACMMHIKLWIWSEAKGIHYAGIRMAGSGRQTQVDRAVVLFVHSCFDLLHQGVAG
jgi:hypothetical protein